MSFWAMVGALVLAAAMVMRYLAWVLKPAAPEMDKMLKSVARIDASTAFLCSQAEETNELLRAILKELQQRSR